MAQGPWDYPVTLTPDGNNTILLAFLDFPEAHAVGDDATDALAQAVETLLIALDWRVREGVPIPAPRRATGPYVRLPFQVVMLDNDDFNAR